MNEAMIHYDDRLGLEANGLLATLQSQPSDTHYTLQTFAARYHSSKAELLPLLKRLVDYGYAKEVAIIRDYPFMAGRAST